MEASPRGSPQTGKLSQGPGPRSFQASRFDKGGSLIWTVNHEKCWGRGAGRLRGLVDLGTTGDSVASANSTGSPSPVPRREEDSIPRPRTFAKSRIPPPSRVFTGEPAFTCPCVSHRRSLPLLRAHLCPGQRGGSGWNAALREVSAPQGWGAAACRQTGPASLFCMWSSVAPQPCLPVSALTPAAASPCQGRSEQLGQALCGPPSVKCVPLALWCLG